MKAYESKHAGCSGIHYNGKGAIRAAAKKAIRKALADYRNNK